MDWTLSNWNPYVEALAPSAVAFGNGVYKEMTKVKWGQRWGPAMMGLVFL